jgi:hypothetical protein
MDPVARDLGCPLFGGELTQHGFGPIVRRARLTPSGNRRERDNHKEHNK